MEPILKVEELKVCYGDFIAVASASLEIERGSITALIGSNGAGKSTLMSAVAGLHAPSGGRVFFKGEDITGLSPDRVLKRGLCLVPQGGRCFTRMTVEDNLLMGSYLKAPRRSAKSTLEEVYQLFPALVEKRKSLAGSLSGGQRQMVAIGRALMAKPDLIMFDEISLGLAPVVIRDLYACIEKINAQRHTSILVVEQDTDKALKVSDTCCVMLKGAVSLFSRSEALDAATIKHAYFGI